MIVELDAQVEEEALADVWRMYWSPISASMIPA